MRYLVKKDGHTLTGFNDIEEARMYAKKVNGHIEENLCYTT